MCRPPATLAYSCPATTCSFTYPNPGFQLDLGGGSSGERAKEQPHDVAPPPLGVLTVAVVGADLESRARKLPPWQMQPVNGRVSLLLQPPSAGVSGGTQQQRAAAAVRQGAFTRRELPTIALDGKAVTAAGAATAAAPAAPAEPERFQFVVSSRDQVLRLLVSHRGRPGKAAYPMGWDHPLGLLEATLEELLEPTPRQVAEAVQTAANTLHAAAAAAAASSAAAAALMEAAQAAGLAAHVAQNAAGSLPPGQVPAAEAAAAASTSRHPADEAGAGADCCGQGLLHAMEAVQHAARYLKAAAEAAHDRETAVAAATAAGHADSAAIALTSAAAAGSMRRRPASASSSELDAAAGAGAAASCTDCLPAADPGGALLWGARATHAYDIPRSALGSMAELVGDDGRAATAGANACWFASGKVWDVTGRPVCCIPSIDMLARRPRRPVAGQRGGGRSRRAAQQWAALHPLTAPSRCGRRPAARVLGCRRPARQQGELRPCCISA